MAPRRRHARERVIFRLREVDRLLGEGQTASEVTSP